MKGIDGMQIHYRDAKHAKKRQNQRGVMLLKGKEIARRADEISKQNIGASIEVHRHPGPGLLESAYEECLCKD